MIVSTALYKLLWHPQVGKTSGCSQTCVHLALSGPCTASSVSHHRLLSQTGLWAGGVPLSTAGQGCLPAHAAGLRPLLAPDQGGSFQSFVFRAKIGFWWSLEQGPGGPTSYLSTEFPSVCFPAAGSVLWLNGSSLIEIHDIGRMFSYGSLRDKKIFICNANSILYTQSHGVYLSLRNRGNPVTMNKLCSESWNGMNRMPSFRIRPASWELQLCHPWVRQVTSFLIALVFFLYLDYFP